MSYRLTHQEMESVSRLSQEARLEHFIKRVIDWEEIWSLRNDSGWVISQTDDSNIVAPFWPHPEYAKQCAVDEWSDTEPAVIELGVFLDKWLPGLWKDGRLVEVFRTPKQNGGVMTPTALRELVTAECNEAYGDDL
ncbi:MAG: DUF2750 domain-containing protein [Comamonadaceae bacterium]|nr:MAG: DUF2750 domain-containing protein [Comamonadaceae bacterium]